MFFQSLKKKKKRKQSKLSDLSINNIHSRHKKTFICNISLYNFKCQVEYSELPTSTHAMDYYINFSRNYAWQKKKELVCSTKVMSSVPSQSRVM